MRYWLARAAKQAREAAGPVKQVRIAAAADKDQSTIYRFEKPEEPQTSWPQETDLYVAAYAEELGIEPIELWEQALRMWRNAGKQATVTELTARAKAAADQRKAKKLVR